MFVVDVMVSPLRGADGNVEFLVRGNRIGPAVAIDVLDACVDRGPRMTARCRRRRSCHPDRPQALELAAKVTAVLAEHGIDVRTPDAVEPQHVRRRSRCRRLVGR